jgi:hypothetical protein
MDAWSTWKYVGPEAELNPIANRFFDWMGFGRGILTVLLLAWFIVAVTYIITWIYWPQTKVIVGVVGLIISWIQFDVARFNTKGRSSKITRLLIDVYVRWGKSFSRISKLTRYFKR